MFLGIQIVTRQPSLEINPASPYVSSPFSASYIERWWNYLDDGEHFLLTDTANLGPKDFISNPT